MRGEHQGQEYSGVPHCELPVICVAHDPRHARGPQVAGVEPWGGWGVGEERVFRGTAAVPVRSPREPNMSRAALSKASDQEASCCCETSSGTSASAFIICDRSGRARTDETYFRTSACRNVGLVTQCCQCRHVSTPTSPSERLVELDGRRRACRLEPACGGRWSRQWPSGGGRSRPMRGQTRHGLVVPGTDW